MNAIHTEMRYLQRRRDAALVMADAAAGPCARKAHELLAQLYGKALDALVIEVLPAPTRRLPVAPAIGPRLDRPVTPRVLRPATPRMQFKLELAS